MQLGEIENAFVGRDGNAGAPAFKRCFVAAFERLLDQRDRMLASSIGERVEIGGYETLVRVHPDPRVWPSRPDNPHPLAVDIEIAVELQLDRLGEGQAINLRRKDGGIVRGQGEGRHQRLRTRDARELPHRDPAQLGLQLPQGAVERVAGAARGKHDLQIFASHSPFDCTAGLLDRFEHALLIIAEIVDARGLTAAGLLALGNLHDDRWHRFEHIAGDSKRFREADCGLFDLESTRCGGCCHAHGIATET